MFLPKEIRGRLGEKKKGDIDEESRERAYAEN
jgi:hypothetical protein